MSDTANIRLAQQILEAFANHDAAAVERLVHPAYREHADGHRSGPPAVIRAMETVHARFSDLELVPEDLVASGDRVVARVRFLGREGDRRLQAQQIHIWRVADGRLAEHWLVRGAEEPVA